MHRSVFLVPLFGFLVVPIYLTAAPLTKIAPNALDDAPGAKRIQHVKPSGSADNTPGTSNLRLTAANRRFANFGVYLQRITQAMQVESDRLVAHCRPTPPAGSYVIVRFSLDPAGRVTHMRSESHSSDAGERLAVASVTNAAPFGAWSDDMKRTLNPEEALTLTFYYR